jgi:hypothetical protein
MCDMAWDGNEPAILRLLDEGVDPTRLEDIDGVSWWDVFDSVEINGGCQEGRTALHNARTRGNVSLVRLLVERAPQLLEMGDIVRDFSLSLSLSRLTLGRMGCYRYTTLLQTETSPSSRCCVSMYPRHWRRRTM